MATTTIEETDELLESANKDEIDTIDDLEDLQEDEEGTASVATPDETPAPDRSTTKKSTSSKKRSRGASGYEIAKQPIAQIIRDTLYRYVESNPSQRTSGKNSDKPASRPKIKKDAVLLTHTIVEDQVIDLCRRAAQITRNRGACATKKKDIDTALAVLTGEKLDLPPVGNGTNSSKGNKHKKAKRDHPDTAEIPVAVPSTSNDDNLT